MEEVSAGEVGAGTAGEGDILWGHLLGRLTPGEEGGFEACRARNRKHPLAHTCMAACWAHNHKPSAGTVSPGRTALSSILACSG